jgi:hypothetical protein
MKAQLIQNVFKMMIGTSALIASTAFLIQTISPVQANENTFFNPVSNTSLGGTIYIGCGSGIYEGRYNPLDEKYSWKKVGP